MSFFILLVQSNCIKYVDHARCDVQSKYSVFNIHMTNYILHIDELLQLSILTSVCKCTYSIHIVPHK